MSARRGQLLNKLRYVSILHFQHETFPGQTFFVMPDAHVFSVRFTSHVREAKERSETVVAALLLNR